MSRERRAFLRLAASEDRDHGKLKRATATGKIAPNQRGRAMNEPSADPTSETASFSRVAPRLVERDCCLPEARHPHRPALGKAGRAPNPSASARRARHGLRLFGGDRSPAGSAQAAEQRRQLRGDGAHNLAPVLSRTYWSARSPRSTNESQSGSSPAVCCREATFQLGAALAHRLPAALLIAAVTFWRRRNPICRRARSRHCR